MTYPYTMVKGSYFWFDDDNKIKYTYSHYHHKSNGYADYTQPHILHDGSLEELT